MISVIVPYLANAPYDELLPRCMESLERQTAEKEVIVVEQAKDGKTKYIYKNKLLNAGIKRSKGEYIFLCDADFEFADISFLERMQAEVDSGACDVVYPMFWSVRFQDNKIADGAFFGKRQLLEKHGPLDEHLKGISKVTFPLLNWMIKNANVHCSTKFILQHNAGKRNPLRVSGKTAKETKQIFKETVKILKGRGAWPA
jgi:glycosyltransferase involved in cell wall biosynthesis